ncbi:DegV family protein [Paenisporosarcina cavernae]|uniref:DegV family protein n=1 Tax=Paenisporosarcina cavernae TaxID=2320858 RepID=A0A385YRU5_9BACL|nr:DegV family protein [Paenisporosarcina cavernae]AYC28468.1 DegV family protein [Paenisporosarcina cavernae]
MVIILTDSSSDLPKDYIEKHHVHVVPLSVRVGEEEYSEGVDLSPPAFFEKMFATSELPKTSQPSPAKFAESFQQAAQQNEQLICLTISSKLSGTYQSALLGKEISNTDVEIIDTLGGSLAYGMLVMKAVQLANEGKSREEIVEALYTYRENMEIFILLDNLENVVKGGRLSKFSGSVAKLLNIKIILEGIQGEIVVKEKVRGSKKFLQRALERIQEKRDDFSDAVFGITHTGNVEEAEWLKNEINRRLHPKELYVNYMGATMGTYAGKGGLIVSFL